MRSEFEIEIPIILRLRNGQVGSTFHISQVKRKIFLDWFAKPLPQRQQWSLPRFGRQQGLVTMRLLALIAMKPFEQPWISFAFQRFTLILKICSLCLTPPKKKLIPRSRSKVDNMEPKSSAFTILICPCIKAIIATISSTALPSLVREISEACTKCSVEDPTSCNFFPHPDYNLICA